MHDKLFARWNAVSLRTKMTGVSVLLLTVGLVVAGIGSMSVLRNYLIDEADHKIVSLSAVLDDSYINFAVDAEGGLSCQVLPIPDYYIGVYTASGELLCANLADKAHPEIDSLPLSYVANQTAAFTTSSSEDNGQWRVLALPRSVNQYDYVSVVAGVSLSETNALIARYAAIFLFFGLTVVILGAALTRLLVTSTFTPLREVEATAARFAAGDFTQRLAGATPNTEVGRLNRSLNAMLNRIDRAFADRAKTIDQMRRFVGDASHELRTPLVSVRGYAELYRMGAITKPEDVAQAMERIEKEAIRMGGLVEDLLELARIDEAKPLQLAEVDLVPIARDAALDTMASAPDRVLSVVVTDTVPVAAEPVDPNETQPITPVPPANPNATGPISFANTFARLRARPRPRRGRAQPEIVDSIPAAPHQPTPTTKVVIWAEENKIRQVVTNLVGNAMRFTPAGSPIEIGVELDEANETAILSVIDHGEGIPPQIREKIFQRFWRADSSRNRDTGGSGLGLAIVASIVAAHKGSVEVVETPGGGATFRVLLPVLQNQPDAPVPPVATA